MITRCFFCHASFSPNETLERTPNARRIAFDSARGRLWLVCGACRRWTLVPIEERWEALEELEKIARDQARVLLQTDNVALLQTGDVSLVRVGRAERREEAWWRFGREYARRQRNYRMMTVAGGGVMAAVALGGVSGGFGAVGSWWVLARTVKKFPEMGRRIRYGKSAWRGAVRCATCDNVLHEIPFRSSEYIQLQESDGELEARYRCIRCLAPGSEHVIRGAEADRLLRRTLAHRHFAGANKYEVTDATDRITQSGSAERFTRMIAREGGALRHLPFTTSIALEIAFNEEIERRLLEMEVAELEERWREEEELAAIVDGELTPMAMLQSLVRRISS